MKKTFTIILAILSISCQNNLIVGFQIKNSYGKTLLIKVYDKNNKKTETLISSSKKALVLIKNEPVNMEELKKINNKNFEKLIGKPSQEIKKIEISYLYTETKTKNGIAEKETKYKDIETITLIEDKYWKLTREARNSAIYSAKYKSSGFELITK